MEVSGRRIRHASTGTRQFCEPEDGIIARHGFECNVRMPSIFTTLLLDVRIQRGPFVDLLRLYGADDADLVIVSAAFTAGVADWVDVQFGGIGFAGEFSQTLSELLLEIIIEVVLCAEEDDAAL